MRLPKLVKVSAPPASHHSVKLVGVAVCWLLLGCPASPSTSAPAPVPAEVPAPAPVPAAVPAPALPPVPTPAPTPAASPDPRPTPAAVGGVSAPPKPLRTCADVRAAYQALLTTAEHLRCTADADCQTVAGECGLGLGGCYHAVNPAVTQAAVSALGTRYQELSCTGPVCRCTRPPVAHCVQSRCALP